MNHLEQKAKVLREILANHPTLPGREAIDSAAAYLESDARDWDKREALQEIGKSAMDSISEMVAALDCDYERLGELRDLESGKHCDAAEIEELDELEEAADECESREEAEQRIHEDALSVQVRSGWYTHGSDHEPPKEFEILLSTGGPATRIIGELDEHGEPTRARLQAQDWGTPWTDYRAADDDTLLSYCRCFYFGEG